jgi:hypothetical protein
MVAGAFEPLGMWRGDCSQQISAQPATAPRESGREQMEGGNEGGEGGPLPRLLQGQLLQAEPGGEGEGEGALGREGEKTATSAVLMMVRKASWSYSCSGPS